MSYLDPNDPNRPLDPTGKVPPRSLDPYRPRADDWVAERSGSSGAMWIGGIVAAVIIIGGLVALSGKVENNAGMADNGPQATTTRTVPAPVAPPPAATPPTTTGQAPAR